MSANLTNGRHIHISVNTIYLLSCLRQRKLDSRSLLTTCWDKFRGNDPISFAYLPKLDYGVYTMKELDSGFPPIG